LAAVDRADMIIAQMLVGPRPVVVFDDSLSAVDNHTDAEIRASLAQRRRPTGGGTVILISDLFDDPAKIIEALHHFDFRQHELVIFHLMAEEELTFPFKSFQRFRDLEGIEAMLRIDPQAVRAAYLERLRGFVKRIDSACGKLRADYVPVNTKTPLRDTLLRYLGGRK
jgi:hypothetical protein